MMKKRKTLRSLRLCGEKMIQVSSHGCEWAAKNVARHLEPLGGEMMRRVEPCELKIMVGFYQTNNPSAERAELLAADKRIIWWVGTDILWLEAARGPRKKEIIQWVNQNVTENWAEWKASRLRLRALGIENIKVVHMPTRNRYQPMPLPPKFTVGCYCYNSRQGFYGFKTIMEAARRTPDIKWLLYPRYKPRTEDNVEHIGRVPADKMGELYQRMSCHVRIVHSDGMPQGPMEAAMCGRPVIYNHAQLEHMIFEPGINAESLCQRLQSVREKQSRGKGYNIEGAEYWWIQNDPGRLIEASANVI